MKEKIDFSVYLSEAQTKLRIVADPVWGVPDLDQKREAALITLGERWLLHPSHSPKKGNYDPWGKK